MKTCSVMRIGWCIVLVIAGAAAHAASFDCAKAKTPKEKAICTTPALSKADEKMAMAYRAVLAAAPSEMTSEIREGQRVWLRKIGDSCKQDNPTPDTSLSQCLMVEYDSRIHHLQQMILRTGGVTFVWRTVEMTAPAPPPPPGVSIGTGLPDHGYLKASWPQTNADMPEWKMWNAAIEAATFAMAWQENGGGPAGTGQRIVWAADPEMDLDVFASLGLVDRGLVTATIDDQWYGHGAAHPNEDSIQFNWLLKEKREVQPEDIFRADSGWARMLETRCDRYLHQTLDPGLGHSYMDDWAPGIAARNVSNVVKNPKNWKLDQKGLTIVFQTYAVACRVCTPAPLALPWADLKPYLNPDFQVRAARATSDGHSSLWRLKPE